MNDISEKASDFVQDLGDAVRRNPASAALIGMGIMWMFSGRIAGLSGDMARRGGLDRIPDAAGQAFDTAGSMMRSGARAVGDNVGSAAGTMQTGAAAVVDKAAQFGREQADTVSQYAKQLPGYGADMIDEARSSLTELFRTQPLALGAIGFAIGAGIAAAMPATEVEAEYLGESADTVREKARQFASEQASRAKAAAESAINAATTEARNQGLTADGVKSAAGEISDKIGRVASAAQKGASERVGTG
ncbi:MAG TPA: hypothetical protein VFQ87_20780 [Bradyrhizobium sp.]|jgi:hypothetical protein|nr:hypothetical protein [Bradyrhizobium sp.]